MLPDHEIFHECFHMILGDTARAYRLPRLPPAVVDVREVTHGHTVTLSWVGGPIVYCRTWKLGVHRVTVDASTCSPLGALRVATLCRWYAATIDPDQCPDFWHMDSVEMVVALGLASHKADALFETIGGRHE
ncbi:hypothetical protein KKC22_01310 [Myxococcota bacterium]|nr:hypothetical protein [Myxococcota bacterium]